ncbi:hypothetical protein LPJ66_007197 [Kickxella alabastrina]|uniref:Uncharacterized protein n=1 Tax=Kickxella alabastrina TaxID=61397 RepID=A0ACC1ID97_9FUNG|nr:hypothetical protein LPJ66_007197 [Kickxella alabastrina]
MSQSENNSSKRQAELSSAGPSKRARTISTDHTPDCQDKHCKGCASGEILLSSDITSLSAEEIISLAEQEEADGSDRPIVSELYETAVKKFADQKTLSHAWALLRLGEYVDYEEYATMAVAMAKGVMAEGVQEEARAVMIGGRARVLGVCLKQDNWRDPEEDEMDEDQEQKAIVNKKELEQGLGEISRALKMVQSSNSDSNSDKANLIASTLAFFSTRYQRHSLINALRLVIMDSALSMITTHIDWDSSDSGLRTAGCRIAIWWAIARSESMPDAEDVGEQIESRLAAVLKYLESQSTDCTCCKLRAQLLIVLSGVVSDEDRAMDAFDSAVEALQQAHTLDPEDQDIVSQLEDLGAEV